MSELDSNTLSQLADIKFRTDIGVLTTQVNALIARITAAESSLGAIKSLQASVLTTVNGLTSLQNRLMVLEQKKVDLPESRGLLESLKDLFKRK